MTAIVAFKYKDKVYLAGDRMGSNGYTKLLVKNPKVFKISDDLYFGYTSSFYMGQLLEHSFNIPPRLSDICDNKYLYTEIVPKLRDMFNQKDFGEKKNEKYAEPNLGQFIMVYKGRIFIFQSNASILEVEYAGVGCGGEDVLSSIRTGLAIADSRAADLDEDDMFEIIDLAFTHCADYMCGVSSQHDILVIGE